jgi:hypothetical protein
VEKLSLDVQFVGQVAESPLLLSLFIQTREGDWLEVREDLVLTGEPQRFSLSLAEDSPDWRLANGDRLFGKDLLRRVSRWGLRLFSAKPMEGLIRVGPLMKDVQTVPFSPSYVPRALPESGLVHNRIPLMVEPRNWLSDQFPLHGTPEFEVVMGEETIRLPSVWVQEVRYRQVPGQVETQPFAWRRPVFRAWWVPRQPGTAKIQLVTGDKDPVVLGRIQTAYSTESPMNVPPAGSLPENGDWMTLSEAE